MRRSKAFGRECSIMCGRGGFDPAGFRTSEQRKTHLSATTVTVVRSGADRTSHKVLVRGAEARMVSAFLRPRQKNLKVRPHRDCDSIMITRVK